MSDLRYTLLTDGTSDRALIPILTWLLQTLTYDRAIQSEWADLRRLPRKPRSLTERIVKSVELFPCDLLFVHRDAENQSFEDRLEEIRNALDCAVDLGVEVPTISVVTVRMQEAWLLIDELAIRKASGNPNGTTILALRNPRLLERLPDPKETLYQLLRESSGLKGRRLKRFQPHVYAPQVSSFIEDFTRLRLLNAFRRFETTLETLVMNQHWNI